MNEDFITGDLPTVSQSASQLSAPAYLSISGMDRNKQLLDTLWNPQISSESKMDAYNELSSFTDNLFIDADTIKGKALGLQGNIRFTGIDALEDPLKNASLAKKAKAGLDAQVGSMATQEAKRTFLNTLISQEEIGVSLKGEVDRADYSRAPRELGDIVAFDEQGKGSMPVANALLDSGNAVLYADNTESGDEFTKRRGYERQMLANQFRVANEPGADPKEIVKFDRLLAKSRYSGKEDWENMSESGFNPLNPVDLLASANKGLYNMLGMVNTAAGMTSQGIADISPEGAFKKANEGARASYMEGADYWKEIANNVENFVQNDGFMNDQVREDYGINKIDAAFYNKNYANIVQEGLKGLTDGLVEVGVSMANAPMMAGFIYMKSADMAVEKNGKDANFKDLVKNLPYAMGYTALNKIDAGILTGKMFTGLTKSKILRMPVGVVAASGAEGLAEGAQTYTEKMQPGENPVPNAKVQKEMKDATILGAAGGGGTQAAISTPGTLMDIAKGTASITGKGVRKAKDVAEPYVEKMSKKSKVKKAEKEDLTPDNEIVFDGSDTEVTSTLEANSDSSFEQQVGTKLEQKKERLASYEADPSALKDPDKTISTMKKEIAQLEAQEKEIKENPVDYIYKNFMSTFKKKSDKMSEESLAQNIATKQDKVDALESTERTPKQDNLYTKLQAEVQVLTDELDSRDTSTSQSEQSSTETDTTSPVKEETQSESKVDTKAPSTLDADIVTIEDDTTTSTGETFSNTEAPSTLVVEDDVVETAPAPTSKKIGSIKMVNGEKIDVFSEELTGKNGKPLLAKHTRNPDGSSQKITISSDKALWKSKYEEKAWTNPKEQQDGSKASPIKEDAFKSDKEFKTFVLQHEAAHNTLGPRKNETIGEYETRVNDEAAKAMGLELYETKDNSETYEVSTKGDKRFSALNAKLPNGKTIEQEYQSLKGTGKGKPAKDSNFDYWGTYSGLWETWAKANPELIDELRIKSAGKKLTDMFAKTDNNQARALTEIIADKSYGTQETTVVNFTTPTDVEPLPGVTEELVTVDKSELNNTGSKVFLSPEKRGDIERTVLELFKNFHIALNDYTVRIPRQGKEESLADYSSRLAKYYFNNSWVLLSDGRANGKVVFNADTSLKLFTEGTNAFQAFQTQFGAVSSEDIIRAYGVDADGARAIQEGGGDRESVILAIGNGVMKSLSINVDGIDDVAYQGMMARSIGILYLHAMNEQGLVEETMVSVGSGKKKAFVKLNIENLDKVTEVTSRNGIDSFVPPEVAPNVTSKEHELKGRKGFFAPQEQTDAINKREQTGYTVNHELLDFFNSFNESQQEDILGIVKDDELQPSFRENNKTRTNSIKAKHSMGKTFINSIVKGSKFYFTEFVGSNGRAFIENIAMNIQTDKFFARHMVKMGESYTVEDSTNWYAAIGLAMDTIKPENINPKKFKVEFDKLMAEHSELLDAINSGTLTGKQRTEIGKITNHAEGMWALQALFEMAKYKKANGDFTAFKSDMTIEIDGVTNGLAFLTFQAGEANTDVLNKVGVFFKDQEDQTLWQYKEKGNLDNYETIAKVADGRVKNHLSGKVLDENLEDADLITLELMDRLNMFGRSMAKKPLMVFLYGMGINAINKHVGQEMFSEILQKAFDGKQEAIDIIAHVVGPQFNVQEDVLSEDELVEYGEEFEPMAKVMTDSLETVYPAISIYRKAMKEAGNALFYMYKMINPTGSGIDNAVLSTNFGPREDSKKAVAVVADALPSVKGFGTSANSRDVRMPIIGMDNSVVPDGTTVWSESLEESTKVSNHYSVKIDAKGKKIVSKPRMKTPANGASAAPVTPIHNADAVNAARAHIGVPNAPGINVHDAVISLLNDVREFGKQYNQAFLEVGTEYSVAQSMAETMNNFVRILVDSGVTEEQINTEIKKMMEADEIEDVSDFILTEAQNTLSEVIARKNKFDMEVVPNISTVAQMNGAEGINHDVDLLYAGGKSTLDNIPVDNIGDIQEIFEYLSQSGLDDATKKYYVDLLADMEKALPEDLKVGYAKLKGKKSTKGSYDGDKREVRVGIGHPDSSLHPAIAYVHELIHATSKHGLDLASNFALKRKLENFASDIIAALRESDNFTDQQKLDYTTWLQAAPAYEILAYGLTDMKLIELLTDMPVQHEYQKNALGVLLNYFNILVANVRNTLHAMGGSKYVGAKQFQGTAYAQLQDLYSNALTANIKAVKSTDPSMIQRISDAIDMADVAIHGAVKNAVSYIPKPGTVQQWRTFRSDANKVVDKWTGFDIMNSKTLQSLQYSWFGSEGVLAESIQAIGKEYRVSLENEVNSMKSAYAELFREVLGDITVKEEEDMGKGFMNTDTLVLLTKYGYSKEQVIELMSDTVKLEKTIQSLEDSMLPGNKKVAIYSMKALAIFMNTGVNVSEHGYMNANTLTKEVLGTEEQAMVGLVDELTTLYAIQDSVSTSKEAAVKMLGNPKADDLLAAIEAIHTKTDEMLFDEHQQDKKIKGFTNNDFDPNIEMKIVENNTDASDEVIQQALRAGYTIVQADKHKTILTSNVAKPSYVQGYASTVEEGVRGAKTRVEDSEVSDAYTAMSTEANSGVTPSIELDSNGNEISKPFFAGNVKRHIMTKKMMRDILKLEERIGHVTGSTASRIMRKHGAKKLNSMIAEIVQKDFEQGYNERPEMFDKIVLKPVWNGNAKQYRLDMKLYMKQNKATLEIAEMIPTAMADAMVMEGRTTMYIRKDLRDIIFGYREFYPRIPTDVTVLGHTVTLDRKQWHDKADFALRLSDVYYKGFVSMIKKRIILFNPVVHMGNAISNAMLLHWNGVSHEDIYKGYVDGAYMVNEYRKDAGDLLKLQVTGKGNTAQARKLQKRVDDNPVTRSMDAGLFSFIMEDLASEVRVSTNVTEEVLGEAIKTGFSKTIGLAGLDDTQIDKYWKNATRLFVTENTPEGMAMVTAMQYSDFISKHIMATDLIKKGMNKDKAYQEAQDFFIDYSYNDSKTLNYLNATMLMPFSKFAIRIQKPIAKMVWNKPTKVFASLFISYLGSETLSVIADNNVYMNNFGEPLKNLGLGFSPFDIFATPYTSLVMR